MKNNQSVLIANADPDESMALAQIIHSASFRSEACQTQADMMRMLSESEFMVVLLDIDSLDLDNRSIRRLTLAYPDVCFLCTSRERFHPELKEALCYHIYACMNKPIDPDELIYWIKSIKDNQADAGLNRHPP